jgi:hypothetical protein
MSPMTATMSQDERRHAAESAWRRLPHGGRDEVTLRIQCGSSHHIAAVYRTDAGPVYAATVHARSHGRADRPDEPHGATDPEVWCDLLVADADDDALPAWCACGHRTLSRAAVREWLAAGEHRVVVD